MRRLSEPVFPLSSNSTPFQSLCWLILRVAESLLWPHGRPDNDNAETEGSFDAAVRLRAMTMVSDERSAKRILWAC